MWKPRPPSLPPARRNSPHCLVSQHHWPPLIAKLRSQGLVHLDCLLIPVEHLPMYSVAIFLQRDTRDRSQQCLPNSSLAKLRPYEKILEKQTGPRPCRIISKEKSVSRCLLSPLSNQRPNFWL